MRDVECSASTCRMHRGSVRKPPVRSGELPASVQPSERIRRIVASSSFNFFSRPVPCLIPSLGPRSLSSFPRSAALAVDLIDLRANFTASFFFNLKKLHFFNHELFATCSGRDYYFTILLTSEHGFINVILGYKYFFREYMYISCYVRRDTRYSLKNEDKKKLRAIAMLRNTSPGRSRYGCITVQPILDTRRRSSSGPLVYWYTSRTREMQYFTSDYGVAFTPGRSGGLSTRNRLRYIDYDIPGIAPEDSHERMYTAGTS